MSDTYGADTLMGGDGADIFYLNQDGENDTIIDVVVGQDLIDLSSLSFFTT